MSLRTARAIETETRGPVSTNWQTKKIYIYCRCVHTCACKLWCMCRDQSTACETCLSPSRMCVHKMELSCQAWQQASLPTEPPGSHHFPYLGPSLGCYSLTSQRWRSCWTLDTVKPSNAFAHFSFFLFPIPVCSSLLIWTGLLRCVRKGDFHTSWPSL